MIKLESTKMTKAIERAKTVRPRVRRLADREYSVTGSKGDAYTVTFAVIGGLKLASCTCKAGQAGMVCFHVAAAAAVNIAVHSNYSRPSEKPVNKNEGVLIKRQPARIEGVNCFNGIDV